MRHFLKSLLLITGLGILSSCSNVAKKDAAKEKEDTAAVEQPVVQRVDDVKSALSSATGNFDIIATLDHHRMAKDEGVYTPPAIAMIFSDNQINTGILSKATPLVGLDLPFKVLAYTESDTAKVSVAYTSGDFIAKRHGLNIAEFRDFNRALDEVLKAVDSDMISPTSLDSVQKGFGIVSITSDYDYTTTVQKLRDIVMAQSDTKWFGEIDYQAAAAEAGVAINPNILLLFGGPAPGGKAMMTSPKIGLDAFCQKLLVYQDGEGKVQVAFNDIVAFARLYYGSNTKPQLMINQRLTATFSKAIKKAN
ncbi:DUF302 domain-containing protein [Lutimonas sp.]|uniref:DUF302 domain-containing protein n=1 Tax=Lutimonas sp. TaxID=1872403 RepID=UPI003D9B1C2A